MEYYDEDPVEIYERLLNAPDTCVDDRRRGHRLTQPGHPGRFSMIPHLRAVSTAFQLYERERLVAETARADYDWAAVEAGGMSDATSPSILGWAQEKTGWATT